MINMAIDYGNRGDWLEEAIEESNNQYILQGLALVQKIATPVKVLNINQTTGRITNGFYEKKSTVDYIGVWNGKPLAFDAKETKVETRFDLSNVKEHQYLFLSSWVANGGLGFLIIHFATKEETYYLPYEVLDQYWQDMLSGGRKSIPYKVVAQEEYRIGSYGLIIIDYLSVLDRSQANGSNE
ncbi:recombination protein U [Orenia metallireducens]|uniref:Holliday junction resolvase RecU n=1 Tax=Orenia metallireducens TaxID=1413210 RepID=A0A285G9Y0_9FIRM|nr:Holliday junction resolvase RecU [Orenia metallireducens]SNY19336.1 recombination protein U [Orenia metallireducens]